MASLGAEGMDYKLLPGAYRDVLQASTQAIERLKTTCMNVWGKHTGRACCMASSTQTNSPLDTEGCADHLGGRSRQTRPALPGPHHQPLVAPFVGLSLCLRPI